MSHENLAIAHAPPAGDSGQGRFTVTVEGHECELDYSLRGAVMTITHTGVPQAVGGQGIAAQLVRNAFEVARASGWKVRPACSYASVWATRHKEYADLLA